MANEGLDSNDIQSILKQSEIERLMMESSGKSGSTIIDYHGNRFSDPQSISVEVYDFRNPVYLSESELRQIRIRHEQFVHYLAARLSMFLRLDFNLRLAHLHTVHYEKFIFSIPTPTFISLFKLEGQKGIGILEINPRLAMTIVDRLLGGKGHSAKEMRELTEIEIVLMDDVLKIMLEEWCRQWEDIRELKTTIFGRENTSRFLQTSVRDTVMIVLNLEGTVGDCTEHIQIALPYLTLEPIIKKMLEFTKSHAQQNEVKDVGQWMPIYDEVKVPISVEWDAFEISIQDLINLRAGDVLELPKKSIERTNVRVSNVVKFVGEIGAQEEHIAVKILESIDE